MLKRHLRSIPLTIGLLLTSALSLPLSAQTPAGTISTLDAPFLFAYDSWEKKVTVANGRALLRGEGVTPRGGGGAIVSLDLSAARDASPALRLRTGAGNTMKRITLLLRDAGDRTGEWQFALPAPGAELTLVLPADAAPLTRPNKSDKGELDLARITQWQLIGDWSGESPMDVEVDEILLVAPDAAMKEQRTTLERREVEEREKQRRERAALKERYPRGPNSPRVESVSLAAPDIAAVTIRAGRVVPSRLSPYQAEAGDERKSQGAATVLARGGKEIGWLIGPKKDHLVTFEDLEGDPLVEWVADLPETFTLRSADDPRYAAGVRPQSVYRKSKPVDWAQPGRGFAMQHIVYLKLPHPLQTGKTYTVEMGELNVATPSTAFTVAPEKTRSESVHVSQIGYRPDDPFKRAYLSLWLGTGGAYAFPDGLGFSLVDERSGQRVHSGKVALAKAADQPERMWKDQNFAGTSVYHMDFGGFSTPGVYRVVVDGVGASYPFEIGRGVWDRAFRTQMRGLFHQRSGVALGPPHTTFIKPRDFHPADGVKVYESTYAAEEKGGEAFKELVAGSTGKLVADAWGGYHDAGDWNPRRVTHMEVTAAHLELLELFPEHFTPIKLNIPQTPKVPDVLTEALFEIDCFRRLQKPDGAVPYGIETPGDPISGEVSWLQSMDAYVLAPDLRSTFIYAGVAGKAAKLLQRYDPARAQVYRDSALKAMSWAEAEYARRVAAPDSERKAGWQTTDSRNFSALVLYDLTGEKRWHDVFLQNTVLTDPAKPIFAWGKAVQRDAAFQYARLDSRRADPAIRRNAVAAVEGQAQAALAYAAGNGFNLTTPDKGKPMFLGFYSTPDAIELVRAHFLTGKSEYLGGAVQACQFGAGGNPNNITYTTGLGTNPIKNPLHLDSRRTGQPAPEGITVYGNVDFHNWNQQWITWPLTYHLDRVCTPSAQQWPIHEAYFDIFLFVAQNEFTVDRWALNVYVWGYLAARK